MLLEGTAIGASTDRARAVIFNADDFGLTPGVNAGIVEAHRAGVVRSASLMVTTPGFEDAVMLARSHPGLDLGIHLALTHVLPALPPDRIRSLVRPDSSFPTLPVTIRRLVTRRVRRDEVELELRAQIERALETGLCFSHLDSHHHVHLFNPVASVAGDLAREYGIPFVRHVRSLQSGLSWPPVAVAKRGLLHLAEVRTRDAYRQLSYAGSFGGFPFPSDLRSWQRTVRALPPGMTEFMCHPGRCDPLLAQIDPMVTEREVELRWLCDPRVIELLATSAVSVTSFADLRAVPGRPGK